MELKIVLQAVGYSVLLTLGLHLLVRIGSTAYFKSKREHLRRVANE